MTTVLRLAGFCRSNKVFPFSLQTPKLLRFSSEPSPSSANSFTAQNDCEGSLVYRYKLMVQRPTTIRWQERLHNSVSFIGRVVFPVKPVNSRELCGAYTVLEVVSLRHSELPFRILLKMWDSMGEVASKHLKELDLIYVSGRLASYTKANEEGKIITLYEVNVKELNYVAPKHRNQTAEESQNYEPIGADRITSVSDTEKSKATIYLWQVFFANPFEWWDNRKRKTNPRAPDFKHKYTGECLWLSPEDPPWVERQLQVHDSRAELGHPQHSDTRHAGNDILKYLD